MQFRSFSEMTDEELKSAWDDSDPLRDDAYGRGVLFREIKSRTWEKRKQEPRWCGKCGQIHAPVCGYAYLENPYNAAAV